jgi:hypothetical protein
MAGWTLLSFKYFIRDWKRLSAIFHQDGLTNGRVDPAVLQIFHQGLETIIRCPINAATHQMMFIFNQVITVNASK